MRLFTDLATGRLLSAVTDTDTVLPLNPGEGVLFPDPDASAGEYATLHIEDTGGNVERVKLIDRVVDSLVVERGFEGSTARSYPLGTRVELRIPATYLNSLFQRNEGDVLDANDQIIVVAKRLTVTNAEPAQLLEGEMAVNIPDKKVWVGAVGSTSTTPLPPVLVVAGDLASLNASQVQYDPTNDLVSSKTDVQGVLEDHSKGIVGHCRGGWYNNATFDLSFSSSDWRTFSGSPKVGHNGFINATRIDDKIQVLNQPGRQVLVSLHGSATVDFNEFPTSESSWGGLRFYNVTKAREVGGYFQCAFERSVTQTEQLKTHQQLHWSAMGLADSDDELRMEIRFTKYTGASISRSVRFLSSTFWLEAIAV